MSVCKANDMLFKVHLFLSHSISCLHLLLFILQSKLGISKILIVDWDVNHGNGTQKMFWKDPRVQFFSVHRREFGTFYPANDDSFYTVIGEGPDMGYKINFLWEDRRCGGADYLVVWDHILHPVAKEFGPDIIIISAKFDAVACGPLGGCRVRSYGYSILLKKLMDFAQGKIVLGLEGVYNLESISNSVLACMKVLLEDKPVSGSSEAYPFESSQFVIQALKVCHKLSAFRPTPVDELPTKLSSLKVPPPHTILSSDSEDEDIMSEKLETVSQDVIEPLSKLKIEDGHGELGTATPWRREFSKVDVWYATFGSNMWKPRFFCYIEGGQVEGMSKPIAGSKDPTPPKEILWNTYPHRLFFGRESSVTWGPGGTAFVNPESSQDQAYLLLYKITLEQFNDVVFQENGIDVNSLTPLFNINDMNSIVNKKLLPLKAIEKGWYNTIVYLGKECDVPVITMTCSLAMFEKFKSGEMHAAEPAALYAKTLKRGLVEGELLTDEEAEAYIQGAATKPL